MTGPVKKDLHPRNKHRGSYDFAALTKICPELANHVILNPLKKQTIDFANPEAVKLLNRALLKLSYGIEYWDIPAGYLCPPIPGRADYIHYLADLLPEKSHLKGLDIGVGANGIYPLIGQAEYGWEFVASDISLEALGSVEKIIKANHLENKIELRQQPDKVAIFQNVIRPGENFDFVMCNPPFHASAKEAAEGSKRKWTNLGKHKADRPLLNFGGKNNELWTEGGERRFITQMITESALFSKQCRLFTVLVSKEENLKPLLGILKKVNPKKVQTIQMVQGQKKSRFLAWSF